MDGLWDAHGWKGGKVQGGRVNGCWKDGIASI
jgi:hypothetical protein